MNRLIEVLVDKILYGGLLEAMEKTFLKKYISALKNREFVLHISKYIVYGVLTTMVSIVSFWFLFHYTSWNENVCNFLSIALSILFAYVLNRQYVFESKDKNIIKEFLRFVAARAFSSVFDMVSFYIFATLLSLNEMIVKIVISFVIILLNYFLSKWLVFRSK